MGSSAPLLSRRSPRGPSSSSRGPPSSRGAPASLASFSKGVLAVQPEQLEWGERLGEGSFGTVHRVLLDGVQPLAA